MRAFVLALAILLSGAVAAADSGGYTLDAKASLIRFELRAIGLVRVRGTATASGRVSVANAVADIDVQVDLSSLKMGRDSYRAWALSEEFFAAKSHPHLTFRARDVPLAKLHRGGPISGDLQVRGVRKTVRFRLDASDCAEKAAPCRVHAHGELSRRAFGMSTRRLTLGDRIGVALELRLVPVP